MKTLSKFILNRNDQVFYYVEKAKRNLSDIHYTVYHDTKHKKTYNQHNFHAIYGTDLKISLQKFAFDAANILIHGASYDENQDISYNYLSEMSQKLQNFDKLNPKIDTKQFIKAIEVYNRVIPNQIDNEIDYNDDYMLINGLTKSTEKREYIKTIEHSYNNNDYEYNIETNKHSEKGIERVKKYDN